MDKNKAISSELEQKFVSAVQEHIDKGGRFDIPRKKIAFF